MLLLDKAVKYSQDVISGKEITTDEVKTQCRWFLEDLRKQYNDDFKYYLDKKELKKINDILKLLNFATGINIIGMPILEGLWGFQAFFLCSIFGWRFKSDRKKYRYRDITLFIPRKNAKSFLCAVILILLMLLEDDYSEFYSICLDRELAAETKKAMTQVIDASPLVGKYFKISTTLSGKITCLLTHSYYQARTAEGNKNNSIRPSAFVCDEMGAFKDYKNYNAMKSGQLSVKNPIRMKTTTAYAENESIMLEELEYIRKVYNGVVDDDRMFALLYYATDEHKWDDIGLQMSNPLRIPENYQEIKDNRKTALEKPLEQEEFLTKHMNIFVQENSIKKYLDFNKWILGRKESIDLKGKHVAVGVDLSITTDLTAVSIVFKEEGNYYILSHGFLPRDNLHERREHLNYELMEKQGYCTICDGYVVDYNTVEQYIRDIEGKYNCVIDVIVSDPYNALQTMENLGQGYNVILLKQTYSTLSPMLKQFQQDVYLGKVFYQANKILDYCVSCATTIKGKSTDDILLCKENKNKQRIDLLVASTFAYSKLYLEEEKYDAIEALENANW
jgi:phage terminase large subunit-like protein